MNILFVAPQPFYQQRGTPIAVRMAVTALCKAGHKVDLLTYHEGEDVKLEGLRIIRIPRPPFVSNVPLGLSWKKLVCDLLLSIEIPYRLSRGRYDAIHAVEEAIFPAALVNLFARKLLIYDMDSALSDDAVRYWSPLRFAHGPLRALHGATIRRADLVIAVCQALADSTAQRTPPERILVLNDVPIEPEAPGECASAEDLRSSLGLSGAILLYVGNLDRHQGIDLLLEAFARLNSPVPADLVVIGGDAKPIASYSRLAERLGIGSRCHFLGVRPLACLLEYLRQADILLSPRLSGVNTPMKIYSYMLSGRAVLATNIPSHTQVLSDDSAMLVDPSPAGMASGLARLLHDPDLRERLGKSAASMAEQRYSRAEFERKLIDAYTRLGSDRVSTAAATDLS